MNRVGFLFTCLLFFVLFFYSAWVGVVFLFVLVLIFKPIDFWKFLLLMMVVSWRMMVWISYPENSIVYKNDDGKVHEVVGQVCLEPDIRRDQVKYIICVKDDDVGVLSDRFMWNDGFLSDYKIGQTLRLSCKFETPFEAERFSYKNYLLIFRVVSLCKGRVVQDFGVEGFYIRRSLLWLKNTIIEFFDDTLLEPVSSLMSGILLGTRRGFSDVVMSDFARTGLTHIIAVSGYNVALVILVVDYLFGFVPKLKRFWLHIVFLICFAFITSLSASVIRATISGVFSLLILKNGLKSSFVKMILWVVVLMTFWNPAFLFYDVSFHLSVLATLGVVFGGSYCKKRFKSSLEEDFLGFKDAFLMTLFAQIFTLPVVLLKFDYLSLVSPFANVLVAPFLPVLMLLGCLLLVFGVLFPYFGWFLIFGIEVLGRVFFMIVNICSKLDWLVWDLNQMNRESFLGGYMLVLGFWLIYTLKKYYKDEILNLIKEN